MYHNITQAAYYIVDLENDDISFSSLTEESKNNVYNYLGSEELALIYSTDLQPEEMYDNCLYGDFIELEVSAEGNFSCGAYDKGTIIINGKEVNAICVQDASPIAFLVNAEEVKGLEIL